MLTCKAARGDQNCSRISINSTVTATPLITIGMPLRCFVLCCARALRMAGKNNHTYGGKQTRSTYTLPPGQTHMHGLSTAWSSQEQMCTPYYWPSISRWHLVLYHHAGVHSRPQLIFDTMWVCKFTFCWNWGYCPFNSKTS